MNREQKQYTEAIASHLQNIQIYASNMPPGIMQPILTDVVALQQAYHDHLDELAATQSYLLGRILSQAQKTEQYYDIRTEVAAIRDSFSALQRVGGSELPSSA